MKLSYKATLKRMKTLIKFMIAYVIMIKVLDKQQSINKGISKLDNKKFRYVCSSTPFVSCIYKDNSLYIIITDSWCVQSVTRLMIYLITS